MNARNAKKMRKEIKQFATINANEYLRMLMADSFLNRFRFCLRVLFRK